MKRRNSKPSGYELEQSPSKRSKPTQNSIQQILDEFRRSSNALQTNNFALLAKNYKQSTKHPILQILSPQVDIFRTNPDRKKKPIEQYLDTINTIYKKKDLDMLISPISLFSTFENWAPRQIAVFEGAIIRFGNQFDFISQLIGTKTTKQCYEFYWQWKNTSHFRAYKTYQNLNNRSHEPFM